MDKHQLFGPLIKIGLICLLLIPILSSEAYATSTNNLISYYNFSETTGTTSYDVKNSFNGTIAGGIVLNSIGLVGSGYNFTGATNSKISFTGLNLSGSSVATINIWVYNMTNETTTNQGLFTDADDDTTDFVLGFGPDFYSFFDASGTNCLAEYKGFSNAKDWTMLTYQLNSTHSRLFVNGTLVVNVTCTRTFPNENYQIGWDRGIAGRYYKGYMDEVGIWQRVLSDAELKDLYVNRTTYPFAPLTPPANENTIYFTNQSPGNNTQYNYSTPALNYNITFLNNVTNTSSLPVTCNLTLNSALINTSYSASVNGTGSFQTPYSSIGTNSWNWTCYNDISNFTSPTWINFVDTAIPTIATNFTNNKLWFNTEYLVSRFNFSDDQILFLYNFTIGSVFNLQNSSLETQNFTTYDLNIQLANYPLKENNVTVKVCDGHTAAELKDTYTVSKGIFGDILQFSTQKDTIKIQEKNKNINDRWAATKQIDRYTFKLNPAEKPKNFYTFIVDTTETIKIIDAPNLPYKKYLIAGNKWIDFKVKGNNDFSIDIILNNNKQAEVTVGNLKGALELEFESIGELNCYSQNYPFKIVNATAIWNTAETETHTQSQYLYLNRSSQETTTAAFYFNATNITSIIKTNISDVDIYNATFVTPILATSIVPILWNYTFYGLVNNITGTLNNTQSVTNLIISNCSLPTEANVTARTYFIYDTDTITKKIANISAVFNVWNGDRTTSQHNFSLTWKNQNNASICLRSDNNEGVRYDLSMIVASYGYATSTTVEYNGTLNIASPTTQNIILISAASNFVLKVINQVSDPLSGYAVAEYEYDVTTDTENFVSSLSTDINGNALFYYTPTKQYRFIIKNQAGTTILNTGLMYIIANPTTVKVDIAGTDFTTPNLAAWNLRTTLYNVSNVINLNWTTLSGTTGIICLNVTHINATKSNHLYGYCSNSAFGNINYAFSETEGNINAVAWVQGSTYVTNILNIALNGFLGIWKYMGVSSMLIYIIFIIIAVAISITRVTAMPLALMAAHVVSWWMGLIPGTWGFTVVVACALAIIMIRVKD